MEFPTLFNAAFTLPAIDNHAHPLLSTENRDTLAFEGLISEANGEALTEDAPYTLACLRATKELAKLYGMDKDATWEHVKKHRKTMDYGDLCRLCFQDAGIHCIFIDDGLGGSKTIALPYKWHDQLTTGRTRRIVRVEIVAEEILTEEFARLEDLDLTLVLECFEHRLKNSLVSCGADPEVVGFKSIVCYRTGMNVSVIGNIKDKLEDLDKVFMMYQKDRTIRLAHKALNDEVVRIALGVAGQCGRPVQFHTGLGDNDITLSLSSPAHLQPIIKAFPQTNIVLLHSSYPYTREAGYLTAVYRNVYLDFGEVFPFVSGQGQRDIIRQVLELSPTNKIMWSSDGHWWPESYYLGIVQARQALYEVLAENIRRKELNEEEAARIIEKALYGNAARLYGISE